MNDVSTLDAFVFGAFGLLIASGFLSSYISYRRLKRWAEAESVTILKKHYAAGLGSDWYAKGLFAGWCYYVKIEDREKHVFAGWVKVGGLLAAILDAKIEVMWDNRPGYLQN